MSVVCHHAGFTKSPRAWTWNPSCAVPYDHVVEGEMFPPQRDNDFDQHKGIECPSRRKVKSAYENNGTLDWSKQCSSYASQQITATGDTTACPDIRSCSFCTKEIVQTEASSKDVRVIYMKERAVIAPESFPYVACLSLSLPTQDPVHETVNVRM